MNKQTQNSNPKTHDSLFKWLIASFTEEFFEHYFPHVKILSYTLIDKEFISKYEALKESLKADIFIAMEIETEAAGSMEAVIHIEHQSKREDISKRIFEYLCYGWLLRKKPIWNIVIYTDDAVWRKDISESFVYGLCSSGESYEMQAHKYNVVKINKEKSSDLIKKKSLLCKLLALKADDSGIDREELLREIFNAASKMQGKLTDDKKLLIVQWAEQYGLVSKEKLEQIKKEAKMEYIASTITEHYKIQGLREGKLEGRREGKREMAKAMKYKGFDTYTIMELSGLPKQEIEGFCIAETAAEPYGGKKEK
jgi:hypothetical protein